MMRFRVLFALLWVTICGCDPLLSASQACARVIPPRIAELVENSELIVAAKVESVSGWNFIGNRRAKATVTEVWKGAKVDSVEYRVSSTYVCDISDAKKGETVLLFLVKDEKGGWVIAWSGRGRMLLTTIDGKAYLSYSSIRFPDETPRVRIPEASEDEFKIAVERGIVKELVLKAIGQKK
jgi:hypothetical protein